MPPPSIDWRLFSVVEGAGTQQTLPGARRRSAVRHRPAAVPFDRPAGRPLPAVAHLHERERRATLPHTIFAQTQRLCSAFVCSPAAGGQFATHHSTGSLNHATATTTATSTRRTDFPSRSDKDGFPFFFLIRKNINRR